MSDGGVYGAQLAWFPELMNDYEVFKMLPKAGAGYSARQTVLSVSAYISRMKGGPETVVTNLRTENQKVVLWTEDDVPKSSIRQGLYVEDNGDVYQFITDNNYAREGGFARHDLQLVTGNNGKQTPYSGANIGISEYK